MGCGRVRERERGQPEISLNKISLKINISRFARLWNEISKKIYCTDDFRASFD